MLFKKFLLVIVALLMVPTLFACSEETEVSSIQVDEDTVQSNFFIDDFDLNDIELELTYEDGSEETVDVTEDMVSEDDLDKLSQSGMHTIEIEYENVSTSVEMKMAETDLDVQLLSIYEQGVSEGVIDGTYEEWLESIEGEDGVSIEDATINDDGELVLTYSDDTETNVGNVVGPKGEDGREVELRTNDTHIQWRYEDAESWNDLVELSTLEGADGSDGSDGEDGVGIDSVTVNNDDELVVTYTDDSTVNLGVVVGSDGQDGSDGSDGVSITDVSVNDDGQLVVSFSDDTETNVGNVVGPKGEDGREVELRTNETHIQWRYEGSESWNDLVELSTFEGADGTDGDDGRSAYEIYKDHHSYQGTEEDWIDDLINGKLGDEDPVSVTFNPENEEDPFVKETEKNTHIERPEDPEKEGYEFQYWAHENHEWYFPGYSVGEDMTLDAVYDPIQYDIEYELGEDAQNHEDNPDSYTIEDDTFTLEDPEKDGYIFTGWTYEGQDIPVKTVTIDKGSVGDLKFTAHWHENEETSYDTDNTEPDDDGVLDTFYYLEVNEDDTFLFIETALYNDGMLEHSPYHGELQSEDNNVYALDFAEEGKETEYVKIDDQGIIFTDEDGTPLDEQDFIDVDLDEIDLSEYGYGYFDLAHRDNGENMQALYESLFDENALFEETHEDVSFEENEAFITVNVEDYDLSVEEGLQVFRVFSLDNPEYYWMSNTLDVSGSEIQIYLEEAYESYDHRKSVDDALQTMIEDIETEIDDDMSELETVKTIHDHILDNVDYAYEDDGETPKDVYWAHNIEGVVLGDEAVCEGYAETFHLILEHFGIRSMLVTGNSNDEEHMWNLVEIDEEMYHFDTTWNDGEEDISYVYFGMSHDSIIDTHDIDSHEDEGIDYLYQLPEVSDKDITFVDFYEDDEHLGLFKSLEAAFDEIDDESADYVAELYDYGREGPLLQSSDNREFTMPDGELPKMGSLEIMGKHIDAGDGYSTRLNLNVEEDVTFNSDITLKDLIVSGKDGQLLDLQNNTMTLEGYHLKFSRHLKFVGGEQSKIINNVDYDVTSFAEVHVNTLETHETFTLRGEYNTIETVDAYDNFSNLKGFSNELKEIDIGTINLYNDIASIVSLSNVEAPDVNIEEVYSHTETEDYNQVSVSVEDLDHMPEIEISGTIDTNIDYLFIGKSTTLTTTIDGETVDYRKDKVNLGEYEDTSLLKAPDLDDDDYRVKYRKEFGERSITPLYTIDKEGNLYRDEDCVETIEDGVLESVSCLDERERIVYETPEEVHTIATDAFEGLIHGHEIILSDNVETLEFGAFGGLTDNIVHLPSSVENIPSSGIQNMDILILAENESPHENWDEDWRINDTPIIWGYVETRSNDTFDYAVTKDEDVAIIELTEGVVKPSVTIPESIDGMPVRKLTNIAFSRDYSIQSLHLPSTLNQIMQGAFTDAKNLHTITFAEDSELSTIDDSAFFGAFALEHIHIPSSVTNVGDQAFASCRSLTVYIEDESQTDSWDEDWNPSDRPVIYGISYYGIQDGLDYLVTDDERVSILGQTTDNNAIELSIPDTIDGKDVTTIDARAFEGNTTLETIFIPDTVTTIDKDAFKYAKLDTIYVEAEEKPDDWDDDWNPDGINVEWDYVEE